MPTETQDLIAQALIAKGYSWSPELTVSCAAPVLKGKDDMYVFGFDGHVAKLSLDCKTVEMIHKA